MQDFTGLMIINLISYLVGMAFVVIGKIGFKKVEKEFSKLNCDISEMERKKRLPYMITEAERKKRLPYLICTLAGYLIPLITCFILTLVIYNIAKHNL